MQDTPSSLRIELGLPAPLVDHLERVSAQLGIEPPELIKHILAGSLDGAPAPDG